MALLFCLLLMAFVEFGRMLLVYNSVANAARIGVRYAIVHGDGGGTRTPVATADIVTVVRDFAGSAPLNPASLVVNVTRPSGAIGSQVSITVVYPYDPLVAYFPLSVNLSSVSAGRIAF